jgi:hypothetical protein
MWGNLSDKRTQDPQICVRGWFHYLMKDNDLRVAFVKSIFPFHIYLILRVYCFIIVVLFLYALTLNVVYIRTYVWQR